MALVSTLLAASTARAQEAPNSDAATLPSPGVWILRQQFRITNYDGNDPLNHQRDATDYVLTTRLSYGLVKDWSLNLEQPLLFRRMDEVRSTNYNDDFGLVDGKVWVKWRPFRWDHAAIDTTRVALSLGINLPWGNRSEESGASMNSGSFDPFVGVALTHIRGRHGINLGAQYRLNFGGDQQEGHPHPVGPGMTQYDEIRLDASYVYRIWPHEFTSTSRGAWYWTSELNSVIELNGDVEVLASPGLMYEGPTYTFETALQMPVWKEVENRLRTDWGWVVGVRVQW